MTPKKLIKWPHKFFKSTKNTFVAARFIYFSAQIILPLLKWSPKVAVKFNIFDRQWKN
jgi:hypothetical protein